MPDGKVLLSHRPKIFVKPCMFKSHIHLGGILMSLKPALFEMKEALMNQEVGQSEQDFIHELETKNRLSAGSLVFYYNNLMMLSMNSTEYSNQTLNGSKKINRKWTKMEIEFMFQYIKERQEDWRKLRSYLIEGISLLTINIIHL
jgi:hypothetical protein